jgi:hypothetical protein
MTMSLRQAESPVRANVRRRRGLAGRKKETELPTRAEEGTRKVRGRTRDGASFPVAPERGELPSDYVEVLDEIKRRIQDERLRVVLSANSAMVLLYWDIGQLILARQEREGWGARVIGRLSHDLSEAYPEMKGFSSRNLLFMRSVAAAYPERKKVKQLVS